MKLVTTYFSSVVRQAGRSYTLIVVILNILTKTKTNPYLIY